MRQQIFIIVQNQSMEKIIVIDNSQDDQMIQEQQEKEERALDQPLPIPIETLNPKKINEGRIKIDQIQKIMEKLHKQSNAIQENQVILSNKRTINKPEDNPTQKNKLGILDKEGYEKIHGRVKTLMSKYTQLYPHTNLNPYQKSRNEFRQKLIQFFLYGGEELRESNQVISEQEKLLLNLNDNKLLEHVKILAIKTETFMFKFLNDSLPRSFKREYKDRSYKILSNLRDQTNFELRRKIFSQKMSPKDLVTVPQIQLYALQKKQKILENKKAFLSQSTVYQSEINNEEIEEPTITLQQLKSQTETPITKTTASQQINRKFFMLIQDLNKWIGHSQVQRYTKRLKEDLPQKQSKQLIENLTQVFQTNLSHSNFYE